ncbi:MAG: metal-dependent transcriptional regulator [Deltaproteobacteria bacterium]|nr:metal-dependent transcriptional regulator [Deltaproteobacteria bacterium]
MEKTDEREELTSNMEDYLEVIMNLQEEQKVARVRDVAQRLKVKMPSVTGAMKGLAEKGLVNYERYSYLTLTEAGEKIAREIGERHKTFYSFLTDVLKLDQKTAELDACRLEHATSRKTFERLKEFTSAYIAAETRD